MKLQNYIACSLIRLLVNQMTFETFESLTFQCLTPQDITVELAALNQKVYNSSLYLYSIDCFGKYILPDFENPLRTEVYNAMT